MLTPNEDHRLHNDLPSPESTRGCGKGGRLRKGVLLLTLPPARSRELVF